MKILSTEQIRHADQYTIKNEPISSIALMERAATGFVKSFKQQFDKDNPIVIICGPGNNGGDGLAIARMLIESEYLVQTWILRFSSKFSEDFTSNLQILSKIPRVKIIDIIKTKDIPSIPKGSIVIDGIFGSGLNKPIEGLPLEMVKTINQSANIVVSIDIPSGMFADQLSDSTAVQADYTYSFQFPKLAFFMPENEHLIKNWELINIQLHPTYLKEVKTFNFFTTIREASQLLKVRSRFSHKGSHGHACLIAGSHGKMGAAILSGKAAIKSGLGLLTTHIPRCGYEIMQISVPESMVSCDIDEDMITSIPNIENYSAIGMGPGLGCDPATLKAFERCLKTVTVPLVIDADGLNILAQNGHFLELLPEHCILTPHPKEFKRLVKRTWNNSFERLELLKDFCRKNRVIVILKDAITTIGDMNGDVYFCKTGNNGMATGGSGDVLTGIILSLLSQGYGVLQAAQLAVHLHGTAGNESLGKESFESLIATDIIKNLGKAFKKLRSLRNAII